MQRRPIEISRFSVFLGILLLCAATYALVYAKLEQLPLAVQVTAGFILSPGLFFVALPPMGGVIPNNAVLGLVVVPVSAFVWWLVAVLTGGIVRIFTKGRGGSLTPC